MINDKEIRTGNLYSTLRNQEILVKGIDTINKFVMVEIVDTVTEPSKGSNTIIFEDLHPISISSVKAERLGFAPETLMMLPVNSDNLVKFCWDEVTEQVILRDGQDGTIGQPIRYLHQFQNIYYHLTGKELVLEVNRTA